MKQLSGLVTLSKRDASDSTAHLPSLINSSQAPYQLPLGSEARPVSQSPIKVEESPIRGDDEQASPAHQNEDCQEYHLISSQVSSNHESRCSLLGLVMETSPDANI